MKFLVKPYDDEYVASYPEAHLSAYGETEKEAIDNLLDLIDQTYKVLLEHEGRLSPRLEKELAILKEYKNKELKSE